MVEISTHKITGPIRGASSSARTDSSESKSVSSSEASASTSSYQQKSDATPETAAAEKRQQQTQQAEAKQLQKLQSRDREVRAHEQAHIAAGGKHVTSGASFSYQRGSDGRLYAVGGEVSISTSAVPSDPRATLAKAEVVRRAALAPAEPSTQDLRVASDATRMASKARVDIAIQQRELQQMQAQAGKNKAAGEKNEQADTETLNTQAEAAAAGYSSTSLASPAQDVFDIVA
ncbi:MAG: putative metalloprotease CJM1_0395 family protein [Gammaproteobacteria bacterium]|nr:putative metalloprotease CJM1_0395 family protein [Gammaproteobacteria bacterium]